MSKRLGLGDIAFYLAIIFISLVVLFPFLWMLSSSFKTQADIIAWPPKFIFSPTLQNYQKVFGEQDFLKYFLNSTIVGGVAVGLSLLIGLPAAYTISRFTQRKLALFILLARLMPGISFLMPWYIIASRLNLMDTYAALIMSHMLIALPIVVWIMAAYFNSIPTELEDSAMVDGRDAAIRVLGHHPADVGAGHHHRGDVVLHFLLEQLHVFPGAQHGEDQDAADRRLQLRLLRRGRLGRRDGGGGGDHGAGDHPDDDLPEIRREGTDHGSRQGLTSDVVSRNPTRR